MGTVVPVKEALRNEQANSTELNSAWIAVVVVQVEFVVRVLLAEPYYFDFVDSVTEVRTNVVEAALTGQTHFGVLAKAN